LVCQACGADNRADRRFCRECGASLVAGCPSCGAPNDPDDRFCGSCGASLGGTAAPARANAASSPATAHPAPTAERRLVTVLFADLVGFTTIAEGRDPEETRELLTRYFDLARDVVERYGGVIEKFIGDAVMAVWGAPVARENDAERSVRAALDLLAAIPSLVPGVSARAGLVTGEAAVTLGAQGQGMVAGDIVNTASRLQSVAAPGTVLVGEVTMHAAAAAIAFEPAGDQVLRGKAAPVAAWVARRVVAEVGGRNRSEALEAPFVGREDELRMLKDLYHATSRDRRTRLVSIVGPAGIGKSRLAWEFNKYMDGVVEGVFWHAGRSPAYGEGIPLWPLGEMVRSRAGLLESDDDATTRAKATAMVERFVPDESDQRWILPAILALLGSGSPVAGSEQLFSAWRTFFERMAAVDPVVMVFEDLHWADSGTLDFIDHLLDWARTVPIFVVTLARPELLERRPDWGAGKRQFTSLFLEPLPEAAMGDLIRGLVPGLPESARQAIVGRADGVPLYAVETVRMLVADGRLVLRDGVYTPNGDLTQLAIPDSLTALIAARLDALDPADRALILDASVLGQSFTPAALSAVSGIDQAQLVPRLRALVRRELLVQEADPRSPELGQFAFVQALIREVAYGTLARRDRKTRHLAAARWFESLGIDELSGALAVQYLAAHANAAGDDEAAALAVQARIALRAAADRARSLGAFEQAASFLRQALAVTSDDREAAELLEEAGVALSHASRPSEADVVLRDALARQEALGDRAAAARVTAALGEALQSGGQWQDALDILEPASRAYEDLGASERAYMLLLGQLARSYMFADRHEPAIETADRVLRVAEQMDAVDIVADVLITRGSALCLLAQPYSGLGAIQAGHDLALAHQFQGTVLRALNNLTAYAGLSDPHAALDNALAGLALARRTGERSMVAYLGGNAVEVAADVGAWDVAHRETDLLLADQAFGEEDRSVLLAALVPFLAVAGHDLDEVEALRAQTTGLPNGYDELAAAISVARGELEEARLAFLAAATQSRLNAADAYLQAGRLAILLRKPDGLRAALDGFLGVGLRGRAIPGYVGELQAGLAALDGQPLEARSGFDEAIRRYRELELPFQVAMGALSMGFALGVADPAVRALAEEGRAILARLGSPPYLRLMDQALADRPDAEAAPSPHMPDRAAVAE
jgi:class 3 adenylate cyclase/tetratricopeptide (TPR) repeat protein